MKNNIAMCLLICALLSAITFLAPGRVWADPPQNVALSYDPGARTLTVVVTHKSIFTGLHYVKQIEIKKNGQTVIKNDYSSQPGKTTFTYTYSVPAAENDVLEAVAVCNLQGQASGTLRVEPKKN